MNLRPLDNFEAWPAAAERCGKQPNRLCCSGVHCLEHLRLYPIGTYWYRLNPEGKWWAAESPRAADRRARRRQ